LKPETVIFAMEEPEIAVPPHTQRRIAQYLFTKTSQAFVTSHSPFVIERFEPSHILLLARDAGVVTGQKVSEASGLTDNEFRQFARWGLCECMLGKAVIVLEGLTELHAIPVAAARMESQEPGATGGQPLDILGATFFYAAGESNLPKFGKFFKTLGLKTFAFYDANPKRTEAGAKALADAYDVKREHPHKGFENLVAAEMPADVLWSFLEALKASGEAPEIGIPAAKPVEEAEVRKISGAALRSGKGAGWAARLFQQCEYKDLPPTVMQFLRDVFAALPKIQDTDGALEDAPLGAR
jgi:putative ATP-dependent endonuclease of OLD family